jgi:dCMP deaminase
MKPKLLEAYMKTAEVFSELSTAKRLHVGAIIVKDNRIISIGYNGMPAGWDNNCEDVVLHSDDTVSLKTKPEVLHAETNAIAKLAKSTESGDGATLIVTHAPCLDCAKLVYQSGINSVYYRSTYRSDAGLDFLNNAGVKVEKI